MKPPPKTLVIDASVAQAAGEYSQHPDSANARGFLVGVLKDQHKIGMTAAMQEEWNKHQSAFSQKWRSGMVARRLFVNKAVGEDSLLRDAIDSLVMPDKDAATQRKHKTAMLKDCHLLEAAYAFDRRVFSADDIVRNHFRHAAAHIPTLRSVLWGNPIKEPEQVRAWLEDGLPERDEWRLSALL